MRAFSAVLGGLVLILVTACSPYRYTDDDETCSRAKPLPPAISVKDDLNVPRGDRSDCKMVKYFKDAIAKVEYRVGTAFEQHNLRGVLTVYDGDGQTIDEKAVDPSVFKYQFEFDVVGSKPYYVRFKASEGNFPYTSRVAFIKKDPCAKCTADQECVGGQCRQKERVCEPECDEDEGLVCEEGQCVSACNPDCRRGYTCDVDSRECVKVVKTCRPRCKRGFYCSRHSGKCRKRRNVKCRLGQVLKRGVCVTLGGGPPRKKCPPCQPAQVCSKDTGFKCLSSGQTTPTQPIVGTVTSTVRAGGGTVFYINRGKRDGVKRGKSGRICKKYRFVIVAVYPTRSKAMTKASVEELSGCKRVVVPR